MQHRNRMRALGTLSIVTSVFLRLLLRLHSNKTIIAGFGINSHISRVFKSGRKDSGLVLHLAVVSVLDKHLRLRSRK